MQDLTLGTAAVRVSAVKAAALSHSATGVDNQYLSNPIIQKQRMLKYADIMKNLNSSLNSRTLLSEFSACSVNLLLTREEDQNVTGRLGEMDPEMRQQVVNKVSMWVTCGKAATSHRTLSNRSNIFCGHCGLYLFRCFSYFS